MPYEMRASFLFSLDPAGNFPSICCFLLQEEENSGIIKWQFAIEPSKMRAACPQKEYGVVEGPAFDHPITPLSAQNQQARVNAEF